MLTNATVAVAPGHRYQFRVRGVDGQGDAGAWATGAAFSFDLRSESYAAVTYTRTWKTQISPVFVGGKAKTSSVAGAKASIVATATTIGWVSRTGPTRGRASIYVDGRYVTMIDLHSAALSGPRLAVEDLVERRLASGDGPGVGHRASPVGHRRRVRGRAMSGRSSRAALMVGLLLLGLVPTTAAATRVTTTVELRVHEPATVYDIVTLVIVLGAPHRTAAR